MSKPEQPTGAMNRFLNAVEAAGNKLPHITMLFIYALLIAIFLVLRYTKFGRSLYAVGGSEQSAAMGADPSEFLGFNPFSATLEVRLKSAYANRDSLRWISAALKKDPRVADVAYQEDLMDSVNDNLRKVSVALLALSVLLTCVSFSLINNTVKLGMYARRFTIHTMKLVGASWGFIRRPFLGNAVGIGLLAALLADAVLAAGVYALYTYEPGIMTVITWQVMAVTGAAVFLCGFVITLLCAYVAVNKFLRMKAGDLYKI